MFSLIHDVDASSATLNNDLVKIQEWAYNWKMSFNPDRNKQAQEVIFSRKLRKVFHKNFSFSDQPIQRSVTHKHLGLNLDESLSFTNCINVKISKTLKGVGPLCKLSRLLLRQSLLTIYQSFIRPHLDYGDVIFDQPLNESLSDRIESVQYKAALAITGAIQGSSQKKIISGIKFRAFTSKVADETIMFIF